MLDAVSPYEKPMKLNSMLRGVALLICASACASTPAFAQDYPTRPITMVIPAAPGGATDILGRVMAEELGKRLGQSVIIDNKVGASGMIGAQAVARATPDGHTLLKLVKISGAKQD